MTRPLFALLALLTLLVVFPGCSESPEEAYNRLVFHAKMGNEKAFLNGFTPKSKRMMKTLLALRRTYSDFVPQDADPYLALVLETVENVEVTEREIQVEDGIEKVERKVATLTVTDGEIKRQIVMIEFDEGWKIDALELQEFWAEDNKRFREKE